MRYLGSMTFRNCISALLLAGLACTGAAQGTLPEPLRYDCRHTTGPIHIDGKLDDAAWKQAEWTSDFVDIEGAVKPKPRFRTRAKMLWDENYLYIAAELEEPDVKATLTQHDSVIFHDNDFEVFLKPLPETPSYYEFEINALNTGWDLFLPKPYRMNGKPDNSWDIAGLRTAVAVDGTLRRVDARSPDVPNATDATGHARLDKDRGWTVEIAYPWRAFDSRQPVPQPRVGTEWRINFSRVEWKAGQAREDNWVWSPQGVLDMHVPERWGWLRFVR